MDISNKPGDSRALPEKSENQFWSGRNRHPAYSSSARAVGTRAPPRVGFAHTLTHGSFGSPRHHAHKPSSSPASAGSLSQPAAPDKPHAGPQGHPATDGGSRPPRPAPDLHGTGPSVLPQRHVPPQPLKGVPGTEYPWSLHRKGPSVPPFSCRGNQETSPHQGTSNRRQHKGKGVLQGRAALTSPGSSGGPSLQRSESGIAPAVPACRACSQRGHCRPHSRPAHPTASQHGLGPSCHCPGEARGHALLQVPQPRGEPNHGQRAHPCKLSAHSWAQQHCSQRLPRTSIFPGTLSRRGQESTGWPDRDQHVSGLEPEHSVGLAHEQECP